MTDREARLEARVAAVRRVISEGYGVGKFEKCPHGRYGYEDCISCYDEALLAALEGESDSDRSGEAGETGTGSTEGESAGRQASPNPCSTLEQRARDLLADEHEAGGLDFSADAIRDGRYLSDSKKAAIRAIITALSEAPAVGDGDVIQADRDAAAGWLRATSFASRHAEAGPVERGEDDAHSVVQLLARHRLSERDAVVGWQSIESAPKDGTEFLAWNDEGGVWVIAWTDWHNNLTNEYEAGWRDVVGLNKLCPTHWMHLPTPPEGEE